MWQTAGSAAGLGTGPAGALAAASGFMISRPATSAAAATLSLPATNIAAEALAQTIAAPNTSDAGPAAAGAAAQQPLQQQQLLLPTVNGLWDRGNINYGQWPPGGIWTPAGPPTLSWLNCPVFTAALGHPEAFAIGTALQPAPAEWHAVVQAVSEALQHPQQDPSTPVTLDLAANLIIVPGGGGTFTFNPGGGHTYHFSVEAQHALLNALPFHVLQRLNRLAIRLVQQAAAAAGRPDVTEVHIEQMLAGINRP